MRNTVGKLMFAATMLLAASFVGGCGDDDSETSGGAGGSGAGGPGAGGSGGDESAGGGGGTPSGDSDAAAVACLRASIKVCQERWGDLAESVIEKERADCTEGGGTVVDACPKDDLLGSCTFTHSAYKMVVNYYNGYSEPGDPKTMCDGLGDWADG